MTEEEAKTKWCPFARVGSETTGLGSINRDARIGDKLLQAGCIASDCMSWRWSEEKRTAAFLEAVQKHMMGQDRPNFNTAMQAVYAESGGQYARTEGRCGLAGSL